ncbi:MAG: multicopper oxidase family protein [Spirulina sp.]
MKPFNRRKFIALSGSTAIGTLLSQCAIAQTYNPPSPQVYRSRDGLLSVDLEARFGRLNLGDRRVNLLSYNGQIPAPRLEAKPGDTVRIRLKNSLSQPTNLHYHGLHVSPANNADNVFLRIPPNETLTYEFTLPKNHPAGTFWYHPHIHGLVAEQVFGGLAGLFIVRGDLDEIPEIKAAREEFLVLKDFGSNGNWNNHPMSQMLGREGDIITVNGQITPNLAIAKGGLLRLRILNASASRFYRLALDNHPLYLIATDGGAISQPVELGEILLTPGERVEVLVKGDREPGQYRLLNLPYNRGGMGMMGGRMMGRGRGRSSDRNTPQILATLTYENAITPLPLPDRLMAIETLPEPKTVRQFTLNHGMAPGWGMVFLINGQMFDRDRIDTRVSLNTVEEWELINTGVMDHPFHLHVNPFQVISRNGAPVPFSAWKDTVNLEPGERVRCRLRFADFTGKTMYHCHILDHEDLGMMGILEIV